MPRSLHSFLSITAAAMLLAPIFCSSVAGGSDIQLLSEYFDLIVSGNFESASYLWSEQCQQRSSRFNIEYTGIPLKIDCSSPIVRNLDVMRDYLYRPAKQVNRLPGGNYSRLEYSAVVKGKLVRHDYYIYNDGTYCWLVYPQDYYCRRWPAKETKYIRIIYHPDAEANLNPVALDEADLFVERAAHRLGLTEADLKMIEDKKIEYFYCDSDRTVKDITGSLTKGTFDLPSNDIISAFFPHYHEITHLLVNMRLRRLPLYTQPIVQEGLAVCYGGRWGKTPSSLMALGAFLYQQQIVELDSLLAMPGFQDNSSSDIAYPVAGLFTTYLLKLIDRDAYLKLYLELSGDFDHVNGMSDSTTKAAITDACGKSSWSEFIRGFDKFIEENISECTGILPGRLENGETVFETDGFVMTGDGNWLAAEFQSTGTEPPKGNILFGLDPSLQGANSSLFDSHYRGEINYEGYRYGIRVDQNEAGVYDYATNHLLAKYISGITPSDEYLNEDRSKVYIKFKRSVIGSQLPSESDYKLLPN